MNPVTLIKPVSYIPSLVDPITEVSTDKRLPFPVVSMHTDTLVLNEVERDDLPEVSLPWQQHNQVWNGLLILNKQIMGIPSIEAEEAAASSLSK